MTEDLIEALMQETTPDAKRPAATGGAAARIEVPDLREIALLLDIDGTLLDLAPTPREVVVPDGLTGTLKALLTRSSGALALVSGRSLSEIDRIFAPERFPAVGGHGAEMRFGTGKEAVASHAAPLDKELRRALAEIARIDSHILVEDKGYSLALHYRLAPQAAQAIHAQAAAIAAALPGAGIELLKGKSVLEVKHAGVNKGSGVRELMSRAPFRGRRPLFIGDDITDDAAFAAMGEFNGLSFSVGRRLADVSGYFDAPADVRAFLAQLAAELD